MKPPPSQDHDAMAAAVRRGLAAITFRYGRSLGLNDNLPKDDAQTKPEVYSFMII